MLHFIKVLMSDAIICSFSKKHNKNLQNILQNLDINHIKFGERYYEIEENVICYKGIYRRG